MVGVILVHASVDDKFHVGAAGAICEGFVEILAVNNSPLRIEVTCPVIVRD